MPRRVRPKMIVWMFSSSNSPASIEPSRSALCRIPSFLSSSGRVVYQEMFFTVGRAILVNNGDRFLNQSFCELLRVGDGRRGEDELGLAAVKAADALHPAEDIGDMRAEHAPVGVHFVNDDKSQGGEKILPGGVVGQDARVEHIGVGEDDG